MRILFVHQVISNGGDYLIFHSTINNIKHELPSASVHDVHIDEMHNMSIDKINSYDAIVLGGGPIYDNRFINPDRFALFKHISNIPASFYVIGGGWYGAIGDSEDVYNYRFTQPIIDSFKTLAERSNGNPIFGCRDYITQAVLNNNGIMNTAMTGCSAWYDHRFLPELELEISADRPIKKIAISDMGITKDSSTHSAKIEKLTNVLVIIRNEYKNAKLIFTFNGGIQTKYSTDFNLGVVEILRSMDIPYFDISGDMQGFNLYDDIDLHIGFRLHTHLYVLSRGIPSILIEEDARGRGANEAHGLRPVRLICRNSQSNICVNPYLENELMQYIHDLKQSNYKSIENAFASIKNTYPVLRNMIKSMNK